MAIRRFVAAAGSRPFFSTTTAEGAAWAPSKCGRGFRHLGRKMEKIMDFEGNYLLITLVLLNFYSNSGKFIENLWNISK